MNISQRPIKSEKGLFGKISGWSVLIVGMAMLVNFAYRTITNDPQYQWMQWERRSSQITKTLYEEPRGTASCKIYVRFADVRLADLHLVLAYEFKFTEDRSTLERWVLTHSDPRDIAQDAAYKAALITAVSFDTKKVTEERELFLNHLTSLANDYMQDVLRDNNFPGGFRPITKISLLTIDFPEEPGLLQKSQTNQESHP